MNTVKRENSRSTGTEQNAWVFRGIWVSAVLFVAINLDGHTNLYFQKYINVKWLTRRTIIELYFLEKNSVVI